MKNYYYVKNIIDLLFALKLIILLSPLFLLIGISIKLTSQGPILFKQERLGQKGKIFLIYKFRTMIDHALDTGAGLNTFEGDPRITKVGAFLRKTSLDELPQLINIIYGHMSFIGPRPPVPYHPKHYVSYSSEEKKRFSLKPGISGYAQVSVRNSVPWAEKIKFDLIYIEKFSFSFDLFIFFKTLKVLLTKENIYPK